MACDRRHAPFLSLLLFTLLLPPSLVVAHVLVPFTRQQLPGPVNRSFAEARHQRHRRSSPSSALLANGFVYVVEASVGTPAQPVSLVISPSDSDTWVPDADSSGCFNTEYSYPSEADGNNNNGTLVGDLGRRAAGTTTAETTAVEPLATVTSTQLFSAVTSTVTGLGGGATETAVTVDLCRWGSFNASRSTSYLPANQAYSGFYASYLDGSYASGVNMTDTLTVAGTGTTLQQFPMGLVSRANVMIGRLGLGSNQSSATSSYGGSYSSSSGSYTSDGDVYANFPERLVREGAANTTAYSIWLDDADGSLGSLLFGAVDTSRYDGTLTRIMADASYYTYEGTFSVYLVGANISASSAGGPIQSNDLPASVTIGVGETFSYLPPVLTTSIMAAAGAAYNDTLRVVTIPCDTDTSSGPTFTFQLVGSAGPILTVALADLILSPTVSSEYLEEMAMDDDGWYAAMWENTCLFGIQNSTSSYSSGAYYNIGASLLRRSYLVFDVANDEIAIAPVKFGTASASSDRETIVPFERYGASTPDSDLYCGDRDSGSSVYYTCTSAGGSSSNGSGSSSSACDDCDDESSGTWTKAVIGVTAGFGSLGLIGLVALAWVLTRTWKKRKARVAAAAAAKGKELEAGAGADGPVASGAAGGGGAALAATVVAAAYAGANRASNPAALSALDPIPEGEARVGEAAEANGSDSVQPQPPPPPPLLPPRPVSPRALGEGNQASVGQDETRESSAAGIEAGVVGESSEGQQGRVMEEDQGQAQGQDQDQEEAAAPRSPKGKGKATD